MHGLKGAAPFPPLIREAKSSPDFIALLYKTF